MPDFDLDAALALRPHDVLVSSPCCDAALLFDRMHWPERSRGEAHCSCAACGDKFLLTYLTAENVHPNCPTDGQRVAWSGIVTGGGTWPRVAMGALDRRRICPACGVTPVAYELLGDPVPL